jgi:CRISPR-associated endonuclease Cas2
MLIVVSYDVPDDRRRTRLAHALEDFGVRVQYSVFECLLETAQLDALRTRMLRLIDTGKDSVRIYRFCQDCGAKVEIHGEGKATQDPDALLTFSIGPVHGFIAQARRVADLWAGSDLLSHLVGQAVKKLWQWPEAEMIFPHVPHGEEPPAGLPNRFVCRVPAEQAAQVAGRLQEAVAAEWRRAVQTAADQLRKHRIIPEGWIDSAEARLQSDSLLEFAWSWVPEEEGKGRGYAAASREGARQFAASRLFRPFSQAEQNGEKCAVCGERTALPDGERSKVRSAWEAAAARAEGTPDERYLRLDQGRLCLVCATKRFYPQNRGKAAYFSTCSWKRSSSR